MLGRRPVRRIEAAVYILVAALVALALLDRLERYAELAERAAVETTVLNLQTALQIRFILASAQGGGPSAVAAQWHGRNPVELVGTTPPGYQGERSRVDLSTLTGGSWFFDRGRGELVYVPRAADPLDLLRWGPPAQVWRFTLRIDGPPESAGWVVRLVPLGSGFWARVGRNGG